MPDAEQTRGWTSGRKGNETQTRWWNGEIQEANILEAIKIKID